MKLIKRAFFRSLALLLMFSVSVFTSADNHPPVVIVHGDDNWAPNEFPGPSGSFEGIHADLVRMAAEKLGIPVEFRRVPWARALEMMKQGQADAVTYAGYTEERNEYMYFLPGNIINQTETRFIKLRNNDSVFYDGSLSSVAGLRIGKIRGYEYGKSFEENLPEHLLELSTEEQMIRMLVKKRLDLILMNFEPIRYRMKGKPVLDMIMPIEPVFKVHDIYLAFSRARNRLPLAERFASVIPEIRESEAFRKKVESYFRN